MLSAIFTCTTLIWSNRNFVSFMLSLLIMWFDFKKFKCILCCPYGLIYKKKSAGRSQKLNPAVKLALFPPMSSSLPLLPSKIETNFSAQKFDPLYLLEIHVTCLLPVILNWSTWCWYPWADETCVDTHEQVRLVSTLCSFWEPSINFTKKF